MRSGLLAGIRGSVCMLKSHRSLYKSFSRTCAGLCIYHLFVWSNWNFLHISQWITLPTQSCLLLLLLLNSLLYFILIFRFVLTIDFKLANDLALAEFTLNSNISSFNYLYPRPFLTSVEIPFRVPSMGQIEPFNYLILYKQMNNTWNHETGYK